MFNRPIKRIQHICYSDGIKKEQEEDDRIASCHARCGTQLNSYNSLLSLLHPSFGMKIIFF